MRLFYLLGVARLARARLGDLQAPGYSLQSLPITSACALTFKLGFARMSNLNPQESSYSSVEPYYPGFPLVLPVAMKRGSAPEKPPR